uniref:Ig-like domain-containing protein n=1 Tax=Electrophorus electricus TaxID=8005 RepID=A0A4W4H524_ELEEL
MVLISGTNTELIRVKPIVHGTKGEPLHLPVEIDFGVTGVQFQGTWYQTSPRLTHLVTFDNNRSIPNLLLKDTLVLSLPNISLSFKRLDESAEGDYQLSINIFFPGQNKSVTVTKTISITVNVPLSTPIIEKSSEAPLVEDNDNVTLTCTVEDGSKAKYQWLKNGQPVRPSERHLFLQNNSTLLIHPVKKEDMGRYSCVVKNPISLSHSRAMDLSVFYGPYNLEVNSNQGQKIGEVFTVDPGELVFFDCLADSNPPNTCVWISRTNNSTEVLMTGPRFEVPSHKLAQPTKFLCRAFNNVTQKQDETHFTLVVAASRGNGREKHVQGESAVSPLVIITITSMLIIMCMFRIFTLFWRSYYHLLWLFSYRPNPDQKGLHRSGHEDATEDFGIYEFVTIPGKMESAQASSRSLARLDSVRDLHTTIYDVIRHVPETPTLSLLK